ncbi:hypothetical protein ScPMuIL_013181 [Solemya velum]
MADYVFRPNCVNRRACQSFIQWTPSVSELTICLLFGAEIKASSRFRLYDHDYNMADNAEGMEEMANTNINTSEKVDKGADGDSKQKIVDLSAVETSLKARTHGRPNLPNVLTQYGLEEKDNKVQKENVKRAKSKQRSEKHDELDKSEKLSRLIEERYRQVMDNLQKRQQISAKTKSHKVEEESVTKKKTEYHPLQHDDSFLSEMHKTDVARIIELQDKMMKEGKLKSQCDVDKFWEDIQQPSVFYSYFKVNRQTAKVPVNEDTVQNNMSDQIRDTEPSSIQPLDTEFRSLSHISESHDSRASSRQLWAITRQYRHQFAQGVHPSKTKISSSKLAALELERHCPRLEMPKLHCFTMDLGEKPPDPVEIQRGIELKIQQKERKKFQRKLHKMHQLAMANGAASNRIMERQPELAQFLAERPLRDVIAALAPREEASSSSEEELPPPRDFFLTEHLDDSGSIHLPRLPPDDQGLIRHSSKTEESGFSSSVKGTSSRKRRSRSKSSKSETPELPVSLMGPDTPLTFTDVLSREKVLEAKCLSTMWTNYLQAGKSVFSQS